MLKPKMISHYTLSQVVYATHFVYLIIYLLIYLHVLDFKLYSFNSMEKFQQLLFETLLSHTGLLHNSDIMHQKHYYTGTLMFPMQNPFYKVN